MIPGSMRHMKSGALPTGCAEILWQALFVEGGMPSASSAGHAVTHAGNMPTQQRRGHATLATNMRCALPTALFGVAIALVACLGGGCERQSMPSQLDAQETNRRALQLRADAEAQAKASSKHQDALIAQARRDADARAAAKPTVKAEQDAKVRKALAEARAMAEANARRRTDAKSPADEEADAAAEAKAKKELAAKAAAKAKARALAQAKTQVAKAKEALRAANIAEARETVDAVKRMNVDLGWWGNLELANLEKDLARAEAAEAARKPGATEPARKAPDPAK